MSKTISFITGSKDKFDEAQRMLGDEISLQMLDIDLPEVQSLDSHEVIKAKLQTAYDHNEGLFIVDDTSLVIESLGQLPGPFLKWFIKSMGVEGVSKLIQPFENKKANATVLIGYSKNKNTIEFFEGRIEGKIVMPRGEFGFGWDAIFELENGKTRAELPDNERDIFSPRKIAFDKLRSYLEKASE